MPYACLAVGRYVREFILRYHCFISVKLGVAALKAGTNSRFEVAYRQFKR